MENDKKYKRIQSLNALRFPMIMMIVLSHLSAVLSVGGTVTQNIIPYINNAYLALDYFFMLSGFGMNLRERTVGLYQYKPGIKGAIHFAYERAKKLYPLYVVTNLLMYPYAIVALTDTFHGWQIIAITIARTFIFIPVLQTATGLVQFSHAFNSVCWFYSSIVIIYAFYPLISKFIRNTKKSIRACIFAIIGLSAVYMIIYNIAAVIETHTPFNILRYESPIVRIVIFMIGMELSNLYMAVNGREYNKSLWNIAEIGASFIGGVWWMLRYRLATSENFGVAIDMLVAAIIIFVFAFERGMISRILNNRIWAILGAASMFIYMIHYPVTRYLEALVLYFDFSIEIRWIFTMIILFTTISISLFCYKKKTFLLSKK